MAAAMLFHKVFDYCHAWQLNFIRENGVVNLEYCNAFRPPLWSRMRVFLQIGMVTPLPAKGRQGVIFATTKTKMV